jgi:hypothetical protein
MGHNAGDSTFSFTDCSPIGLFPEHNGMLRRSGLATPASIIKESCQRAASKTS